MMKRIPTHPGKILKEDVLIPLGISVTAAARDLKISRKALSEFVNEKSSLSPEMALRIAHATGTTPESWMKMQMKRDLWEAGNRFDAKIRHFGPVKKRAGSASDENSLSAGARR
jgi:addiction module HigA family antidote